MLEVPAALAAIRRSYTPLPPVSLPLARAAGRRLAEPIHLDLDTPPFDRALVDGYALRAADASAGTRLRILGRHDAGAAPALPVTPGACVAINTGAPLPSGADAVIMVEQTRLLDAPLADPGARPHTADSGWVELLGSVPQGAGIQRRGADARAGSQVLPAGAWLSPAALAVAAAAGAAHVSVIPAPRIALLVTGDELVPLEQRPGPAQIRNANSILLEACIKAAGATLTASLLVRDEEPQLRAALQAAWASADLLIVTGGMSMGTRDLIPPLLLQEHVTFHVEKVRLKPGLPFLFGTRPAPSPAARQYVAGLPGNPVSAFVCFYRLVMPLLDGLAGGSGLPPLCPAITTSSLAATQEREFCLPAVRQVQPDGRLAATPLPWRGSADLLTLAQANALIVQPPHRPPLPPGAEVQLLCW